MNSEESKSPSSSSSQHGSNNEEENIQIRRNQYASLLNSRSELEELKNKQEDQELTICDLMANLNQKDAQIKKLNETIGEHKSANEELKSANEELKSFN